MILRRVNTQLLLIDPQNDFCDLPPALCAPGESPALPVAGAHADLQRAARFIEAAGARLDAITVTLDSHLRLDIAHPGFWRRGGGEPVAPFTPITAAQVRAGEYAPREARALPRTLAYLDELEARGRYTLMVWPVHCEIGSWGQAVHPEVRAAYNRWEEVRQRHVRRVNKGQNPWTEHYSALMAEVPDPADPGTQLNRYLLDALSTADLLFIGGEASSHCVRATVEHLDEYLPAGDRAFDRSRLVLLTDCMSPVGGFEPQAAEFLAAMQSRGLRAMSSTDALALLPR